MDAPALKAELKKLGIKNERELDAALKKLTINLGVMVVRANTDEDTVSRSAS